MTRAEGAPRPARPDKATIPPRVSGLCEKTNAMPDRHPPSARRILLFLLALSVAVLCRTAPAQEESVLRDQLDTLDTYRNRVEMGFLTSGADADDLDDGVFDWDYLVYSAYYYTLNDHDSIRLRHQYWRYLSKNYRNLYSARWRRTLDGGQAISVMGEYSDNDVGTDQGTLYFGYEDTVLRDLRYFARAGVGYNSESDWTGYMRLEGIKPITASTLLRMSDSFSQSTSGFRSNTLRLNLIQLLHERLALNVGYRFYADWQADGSAASDVRSHEGTAGLTWQARDDLYLTGGYSHYRNSEDVRVNTGSLEATWQVNKRVGAVAGYRAQFFDGGPVLHGFQVGLSYDF